MTTVSVLHGSGARQAATACAVLEAGVRAVFALPVAIATTQVGTLAETEIGVSGHAGAVQGSVTRASGGRLCEHARHRATRRQ